MRTLLTSLSLAIAAVLSAQQMTLDWATPTVPAIHRVKYATNGDVFSLGTGSNSAVLQRFSSTGNILWTRTLSAPTLYAIDMDVDGSDNVFIYVGFTTGQLDLDPGPNTALVDPGKVYAKYNGNGQYQWGFSVGNTTDLSEDYGGVSCDDAGNLYICGDLGQGTYDMDPGPGVSNIVVGTFSTGAFMARYRPDGSLAWADVRTWYGGFSSCRDIAVMRDGSSFFIVQALDNGGPLSSQIDVDPGPGTYNVYTETTNILRYDSAFTFMAQGYCGSGDLRLCADAAGSAYMMGGGTGSSFAAVKYNQSGQTLEQVYQTSLLSTGNLRLGDIAPDEQGGCLGSYSNNCTASYVRFYKMNVSGLVDFNLSLYSGTDCTLPGGKGFDLRGGQFVVGTYNQNYTIDFEPGAGVLNLPAVTSDDGVVAQYGWCSGAPYDPIAVEALTPVCANSEATFVVEGYGDASGYAWTLPGGWAVVAGEGTGELVVSTAGEGFGLLQVAAMNACGTSAPISGQFYVTDAQVNAGADQLICPGQSAQLIATTPNANSYLWEPGGATASSIEVTPSSTTTYTVTINSAGCLASDEVIVVVDPCLGVSEAAAPLLRVSPVPVSSGAPLRVEGLGSARVLQVLGADGRVLARVPGPAGDAVLVPTDGLAPGAYRLRLSDGRAVPFVVVR